MSVILTVPFPGWIHISHFQAVRCGPADWGLPVHGTDKGSSNIVNLIPLSRSHEKIFDRGYCVVNNENAKWSLRGPKRGVVLLLPIRIVGVVGG